MAKATTIKKNSPEAKRLDELATDECRWPTPESGRGNWRFCGQKSAVRDYCLQHAREAYKHINPQHAYRPSYND